MVDSVAPQSKTEYQTATLAGGCFWCLEAVFKRLNGVISVTSGYTGGHVPSPTYDQVCSGQTGHAEAVQILFDPSIISYEKLLSVFWQIHDPTTLDRQGNDVGTQYRSAIYYHSDEQKEVAERSIEALEASGQYDDPIVTQLEPAGEFYKAETYHQDYYDSNRSNPYCRIVIDPKVRKLFKDFKADLKPEEREEMEA